MTKELIAKYESGKGINDMECLELYNFYCNLERGLQILGRAYDLPRFAIMADRQTLENFLVNRGVKFSFI